jgi:hypothetical protein
MATRMSVVEKRRLRQPVDCTKERYPEIFQWVKNNAHHPDTKAAV